MRICLFSETALPKIGGQEMVIDALARRFTAAGHDARVFAQHPRRRIQVDDSQRPYPVHRHMRFVSTHRLVSWYRWWLLRLHRSWPFDIVHCHSVYPTGYVASLLRGVLPAPLVITSHGGDIHLGNRRFARRGVPARYRQAVATADALVAISEATAAGYSRLDADPARVHRIPNGVDWDTLRNGVSRPDDLDPAIQSKKYFLTLSRLHYGKGLDILLDAVAQLHAQQRGAHHAARVVIAGTGSELDNLKKQAERLGIASQVRFTGEVSGDRKTWLLQNAVALVAPSRAAEGLPLVLAEGCAAGRPIIASRHIVPAEMAQHGTHGWLLDDVSPSPLATFLAEALDQPERTERMAQQAADVAQRYDWNRVAAEHLQLYARLLATNEGRQSA